MFHTGAFFQNVDQGAVFALINGVPDQAITVNGQNLRVPLELPFLTGAYVGTAATGYTNAQVQTPTLRELAFFDVPSRSTTVMALNPPPVSYFPGNPLALTGYENMNFGTNTDNAAATDIYGVIWLSDGPVQPVEGPMFTVRCTGAATLVAGTWVNTNLTFTQVLPFGDYQVVGLRVESQNAAAARLVFQGYPWRPGVLTRVNPTQIDMPLSRYGQGGVYGQFNTNVPPTLDVLGSTDTTQSVYLDLIKVG
jgi:hypothetical protein